MQRTDPRAQAPTEDLGSVRPRILTYRQALLRDDVEPELLTEEIVRAINVLESHTDEIALDWDTLTIRIVGTAKGSRVATLLAEAAIL